ncbi:MAG: TlpA disulfide reductase family protein [Candidatus Latescibacterota bacterium]
MRYSPKTILAFTLFALLSCVTESEAKQPRVEGDRLIFELPDLEGSIVKSSDERFKDKVVFVTIWGTWCPPCRSEVPTFVDLQNRYRKEGLEIVAIAFERDAAAEVRRERLRKFSAQHEINYLVLDGGETSDFSKALPMVVDVKGLPIEIMIDRSGKVVKSRNGYGYKKRWARDLERDLRRLLNSKH